MSGVMGLKPPAVVEATGEDGSLMRYAHRIGLTTALGLAILIVESSALAQSDRDPDADQETPPPAMKARAAGVRSVAPPQRGASFNRVTTMRRDVRLMPPV